MIYNFEIITKNLNMFYMSKIEMQDLREAKKGDELQVVLFSLHDELFGLDISRIIEIHKPQDLTTVPNSKEHIKGVINLRGKIIIIMDLNLRLGLPKKEETKHSRVIVIEHEGEQVGLEVDSVSETIRIKYNEIQPPPPIISKKISSKFLHGISAQGDQLLILLELNKLLVE